MSLRTIFDDGNASLCGNRYDFFDSGKLSVQMRYDDRLGLFARKQVAKSSRRHVQRRSIDVGVKRVGSDRIDRRAAVKARVCNECHGMLRRYIQSP